MIPTCFRHVCRTTVTTFAMSSPNAAVLLSVSCKGLALSALGIKTQQPMRCFQTYSKALDQRNIQVVKNGSLYVDNGVRGYFLGELANSLQNEMNSFYNQKFIDHVITLLIKYHTSDDDNDKKAIIHAVKCLFKSIDNAEKVINEYFNEHKYSEATQSENGDRDDWISTDLNKTELKYKKLFQIFSK